MVVSRIIMHKTLSYHLATKVLTLSVNI